MVRCDNIISTYVYTHTMVLGSTTNHYLVLISTIMHGAMAHTMLAWWGTNRVPGIEYHGIRTYVL
jgi:hypothetical protein